MEEAKNILYTCVFLFSLWIGGAIFSYIYAAPIGHIFAGMIFSEQLVGIIPFEDAFSLIGEIGLLLIVFEGGLHTQISKLRTVGFRAFLMALAGVILPIAFACAMFIPMNYHVLAAVVAGTALASTSIGMSLQLLSQNGQLETELGQLVSAGAMIDDVLCLILLSVVSRFGNSGGGITASKMAGIIGYPLLASFVASIVGGFCCWVFPKVELAVFKKLANYNQLDESMHNIENDPVPNLEMVDLQEPTNEQPKIESSSNPQVPSQMPATSFEKFLIGITLWMTGWGTICAFVVAIAGSSNLLGAYVAGLSFCSMQFSHQVWKEHIEPLAGWMVRLFFGSIGFLIPIRRMFHAKPFGFGILWTILSVVAKLACSFFAPNIKRDGLAVGWAMVARGELGFVIASRALSEGVIDSSLFEIVVWALVLTTVCAPFPFSYFLRRSIATQSTVI